MAFPTQCFLGGGPAYVTSDKLPHVFKDHPDLTAALMNNVFRIYYNAYHALDQKTIQASGTRASKGWSDLKDRIQADLRDAASAKSTMNFKVPFTDARIGGFGQSLYDVFQDLEQNNGVLKSDDCNGNGIFLAPAGVIAFQDEMIKRGSEVAASVGQFNAWRSNMQVWKQKETWDGLGTSLWAGGKVIDLVAPKLWAAVGASEKTATSLNLTVTKWWGYGEKVKGMMDMYNNVKSSPNQQRQLVAEAAAFVVENAGLPMFGSLYAGVIRDFPKAMAFFEDYAKRTRQAIESVGR